MTHEQALRAVDRHFTGSISPVQERALRAHLPDCARCTRRYQRQLLLAELDPRIPSAEDRLARGLGLVAPRRRRAPFVALSLLALGTTAVALALFVVTARTPPEGVAMRARGAGPPTAPSLLWVYRLHAGGIPELATDRIGRGDELAFAYANPAGHKYLCVFATDEHGHVYWYYPAWPSVAPPGTAIAARDGAGPHELPEAVRHRFDGRRLEVHALFSDEPIAVAAVERALASGAPRSDFTPPAGTLLVRHSFEVTP